MAEAAMAAEATLEHCPSDQVHVEIVAVYLANDCSTLRLDCGRRDRLQEKEDESDHLFRPTVEIDAR